MWPCNYRVWPLQSWQHGWHFGRGPTFPQHKRLILIYIIKTRCTLYINKNTCIYLIFFFCLLGLNLTHRTFKVSQASKVPWTTAFLIKARHSSGCSVLHVVASCTETQKHAASPACVQTLRSESRSHTPGRPQSSVRGAPPPLGLSYLHTHLSLTCCRGASSATACCWDTIVCSLFLCVCVWAATVEFTLLDFSCSASEQTGDRYRLSAAGLIVGLWWQADASRCLTLWASPSGKHHCEFLRGGKSDSAFCFSLCLSLCL